MKTYFAYTRVSTTRQGEGVSLQEQRAAILEYAGKRYMTIARWYQEQESAAKRGRPVFSSLVSLLKSKKAAGIIIHKIDRGARNLRDWADMAELMDSGVEVHLAHESIDLHTRSGRLSADILAVVAADYIRNLREETIKGIQGRLKQGLIPFGAPLGYLNNGGGKVKTIDPVRGALVRQAFELYASRSYSLHDLVEELFSRGLRNNRGNRVGVGRPVALLRNPFYMGLIRISGRNETFVGAHVPLITSSLYNQVQLVLDGNRSILRQRNQFLFSRLLKCGHCGLSLVGERQKGQVYYRCHRRICPPNCIREERVDGAVLSILNQLTVAADERLVFDQVLAEFKARDRETLAMWRRQAESELENNRHSAQALLQRFLDGEISQETFDSAQNALFVTRKTLEEKLTRLNSEVGLVERVEDFAALQSVVSEKPRPRC